MEKEIKKLMQEFEYMLEEEPEKILKFTKHLYHHNPEAVKRMLMTFDDNGHIRDKETYEEIVECLEWSNEEGSGEKWSVEKIKKSAGINFEQTDFSEFDYAYLVNFLYAKCCKHVKDPYVFLKIARGLLEDKHKQIKLHKGSYHQKHKYHGRGEESYYDLFLESDENEYRRRSRNKYYDYDGRYDEEDRRRYRSENDMNEENRRGYRTENDNDYQNEYRRYYKESNMGFSTK